MRNSSEKQKKTEYAATAFLLLVLAGSMLYLTYHQAYYAIMGYEEYHSDVLAYMQEVMGIDSGYSFPYPVMFWLTGLLYRVLPIEWSVALVITGLQCVSFMLLRYYFGRYLYRTGLIRNRYHIVSSVCAFLILFYSMIFVYNHPFYGTRFYYMGVFSPNPFHNATYLAARPFCIIVAFAFADILDSYEQKLQWKEAVCFAAALLLATMTKPSFTIVFCGAAGLIMLYRMFRSGFANFKNTMLLGCMFLPTFADLLYQFSGVFMGTDSKGMETGIGFGLFKVWREYCSNYIVAIALMICFPIVVLIFQYRRLCSNTLYRFGWQMYGMGLAMFILLYEKGFRAVDANFSWGYMIGGFFLVMSSLIVLLEDTLQASRCSVRLLVQWGTFALHVVCGIFYFGIIFFGGSYY